MKVRLSNGLALRVPPPLKAALPYGVTPPFKGQGSESKGVCPQTLVVFTHKHPPVTVVSASGTSPVVSVADRKNVVLVRKLAVPVRSSDNWMS